MNSIEFYDMIVFRENQTYSRHTKDTEVLINIGRQCLKNSFLLVD
ncbi:hypothetical protein T01_5534 [Trichinella spiralis]|uniref:Uncharacterized protein n=1 Tax=Trichinella spiralis TaxID=6334 RepID=A0A0V0YWX7_TRISP|nr:hypothetical protein T01_5534 [Trichinella spiralis]